MDVQDILKKHKQLNFVRRIMDPTIYPNMSNEDGTVSTHKMAYGEADGKYYVYPTIVQEETGKLKQLSNDDAWEYAMKTGEHIVFDKEEDAAKFSRGAYKKRIEEPYDESLF